MQKLWDTYFRKKQQQSPSNSSSSPTTGQRSRLTQQLSLTTSNATSSPRFGRANISAIFHHWQSTSELPLSSSSSNTPVPETKEPEEQTSNEERSDEKRDGEEEKEGEKEEAIFTFCKPVQKSLDDACSNQGGNQLEPPIFSPTPQSDQFSSPLNQPGSSSPPPSPTRINLVTRPISKSISSEKESPPISPIVPKSSSSSPCFLSPTPDSELLGFDPQGLGSNSLELPQQSRSISCDDVRKYKKSSSGSIGGIKKGKPTSPVAQYYQAHHDRSASMVGDTIGSPSSLEVPVGAKSSRSKSFDSASAAKAGIVQECQPTSISSEVIPGIDSGLSSQAGKRRVQGSGRFLEIPKWKMLIRRSSAAVGAGQPSGPGGIGSNTGSGSTFTIDETTGLYWRDCIHCLLLIEMLKISPPPASSCKSSVSSEGSQEGELSSNMVAPISSTFTSSSTFTGTKTGRNRSASCQSALESVVDTNLMVLEGYGSCFTEESDEIKVIEESAIKSTSVSGEGSNVNSGSPSPIPVLTLSFAPDDEFQTEEEDLGNGVTVISLEVPVLPKSGRSASMDNSYLQVPREPGVHDFELPPGKSIRSRSVDIALPVGTDGPYIVVPSEKPIPATTQ